MVDTGGLEIGAREPLARKMMLQVEKAVGEADLCLFLCDLKDGPTPLDRKIADWIRPFGKEVLLVVNKVDRNPETLAIHEFASLGFGSPIPIASLHGLGIGDLLDQVVEQLKGKRCQAPVVDNLTKERVPGLNLAPDARSFQQEVPGTSVLKIAVVGRPNVGKSSLVNRILNEERVLVDETPGTTRDPVDTTFTYQGRPYCLIDTAGIRARKKLKTKVDWVSRLKTSQVIERSDVCVGMLDATVGLVQEDLKLLDEVVTAGRALVLAVNKWDLARKGLTEKEAAQAIFRRAPFIRFAPVIAVSAKTGHQVPELLEQAAWAASQASRKMTASEKQRLLAALQNDPRAPAGVRNMGLLWIAQMDVAPPRFHFVGRMKRPLSHSDGAYLERTLRSELDWQGTPVWIQILKRRR